MEEKKKDNKILKVIIKIIELAVLLSFIALTYWIGSKHEHWADEAQAWLLARDSDWLELITVHSKYEGSPMLWHLILKCFISCGLTYEYFFIVPVIFSSIGVAILQCKKKIPLFIKILLPFAYYIFYQYTIVARSYCLIFPALMLLSIVYNDKTKKPFLFALCIVFLMTISTHTLIVAACICFVYGIELLFTTIRNISKKYTDKKLSVWKLLENWLIAILLLACFLGVAYFLIPAKDQSELSSYGTSMKYGYLSSIISDSLVTNTSEFISEGYDNLRKDAMTATIVAAVAVVLLFAMYWRDKRFFEFVIIVLPLYLFLAFYYCNKWHIGMLFETIVFCLIVHQKLEKINFFSLVFAVICGVQIYYSYISGSYDLTHTYSASYNVAEFIKNNNYEDKVIYGVGYSPTAIEPYFDKSIFANKKDGKGYYQWRTNNPDYMTIDEMKKNMPDIVIIAAFRDYNYISIVNRTESSNLYEKHYIEGATYVKDGVFENEGFNIYINTNILHNTNVNRVVFDE